MIQTPLPPVLPLTEEIRLEFFGSRDLTIWSLDLLSDRDSVYTHENLYENWGLPRNGVWYVRGLPWKLLEILTVVIILSPISIVCGYVWQEWQQQRNIPLGCTEYEISYSVHRLYWIWDLSTAYCSEYEISYSVQPIALNMRAHIQYSLKEYSFLNTLNSEQ